MPQLPCAPIPTLCPYVVKQRLYSFYFVSRHLQLRTTRCRRRQRSSATCSPLPRTDTRTTSPASMPLKSRDKTTEQRRSPGSLMYRSVPSVITISYGQFPPMAKTPEELSMISFIQTVLRGMQEKTELRKDLRGQLQDFLCRAIMMHYCGAAETLLRAAPWLVNRRVAETAASTGIADMLFTIMMFFNHVKEEVKLDLGISYEKLMLLYLDAIEPMVAAGTSVIPSSVRYSQNGRYNETTWQCNISNVIEKLQLGMPRIEFNRMKESFHGLHDIMIRCMRLGACGAVVALIDECHELVNPEILNLAARLGNASILRVFIDQMESKEWQFHEIVQNKTDTSHFTYFSLMQIYFNSTTGRQGVHTDA
eukprot:2248688-Pleurochrysis_carterae.AAC.1